MEQQVIATYFGDDTEDPIAKINSKLEKASYFDGTEPGLFNPLSSSIIKLRNNGMIDIFVSTNQGVRIDPATKSINFFVSNEKHSAQNVSAWVEYNFKVEAKRLIELTSEDMNLNVKKQLYIHADAYQLVANKATMKCDSLSLDVPEDNLMLAGKPMAAINKQMKDTQDLLDKTRQDQQQQNDSFSNSINSLWQAMSSKGGST